MYVLPGWFLPDLLNVIEIVGEGGMDVGESDRRNVRHDLVGGHALVLMPHHDIEHTDTVAGDAGLSAADAGRPGDPVLGRGHYSSINRPGRRRGRGRPRACPTGERVTSSGTLASSHKHQAFSAIMGLSPKVSLSLCGLDASEAASVVLRDVGPMVSTNSRTSHAASASA